MRVTFDPIKSQRNLRDRDLSFDQACDFNFEGALFAVDQRMDYKEVRFVAIGRLHGRLHVLCFTEVADGIRVISFRKANTREVHRYEKSQAVD